MSSWFKCFQGHISASATYVHVVDTLSVFLPFIFSLIRLRY